MAKRTFEEVVSLVASNNKSVNVSNELLTCLIWKESGFDDAVKNASSSAIGFMQVTRDSITDVNANTPKGVHFDYKDMTDAAKNIQCGSYYLDIRIKRAGGDAKKGIERYGTGSGYADNIIACETCLKGAGVGKVADQLRPCLFAIHT